ncbi:hypothetical protein [Amycolatopsis sp. YIM 10]|nr:hypothetical protein [Amycolatopsis sp. YIM 10]QFU92554.1 hypothetical protein YIM_36975 [Amycolatopsis sp. YIM 10]
MVHRWWKRKPKQPRIEPGRASSAGRALISAQFVLVILQLGREVARFVGG